MSLFKSLHPQAHPVPTDILAALLDLLIIRKPDWLSTSWTQLWNSIFSWHSCINTEDLCFSQVSVLSILQYKQSQCTSSIRTAFMSICGVPSSGGSVPYYNQRIPIRYQTFTLGEPLAKPKHKCYGTLGFHHMMWGCIWTSQTWHIYYPIIQNKYITLQTGCILASFSVLVEHIP